VTRRAAFVLGGAFASLAACNAPATAPPEAPVVAIAPPRPAAVAEPAPIEEASRFRRNGDAAIPVFVGDPVLGPDDAPLTVVFFGDFECPPCAVAAAALERVRTELPAGALRIVWKNYPLERHTLGLLAARTGAAIFAERGSEAFWRFHERVFSRSMYFTPTDIVGWAEDSGLPGPKLESLRDSPAVVAKVASDIALAEQLALPGVPAVFLNCRPAANALDRAAFEDEIEAELDEAAGRSYPERCEANRAQKG
jgi:protein-disulfide isomerase